MNMKTVERKYRNFYFTLDGVHGVWRLFKGNAGRICSVLRKKIDGSWTPWLDKFMGFEASWNPRLTNYQSIQVLRVHLNRKIREVRKNER